MKGYVIISESGNYPLYICLSKKEAEELNQEINISCYILETPVIQSHDRLVAK